MAKYYLVKLGVVSSVFAVLTSICFQHMKKIFKKFKPLEEYVSNKYNSRLITLYIKSLQKDKKTSKKFICKCIKDIE